MPGLIDEKISLLLCENQGYNTMAKLGSDKLFLHFALAS